MITKFFLFISIFLLALSTTLSGSFELISEYLVYIAMLLPCLAIPFIKKNIIINKNVFCFLLVLPLIGAFSAILNSDIGVFFSSLLFFILFFLGFFVYPNIFNRSNIELMLFEYGVFFSFLILCYVVSLDLNIVVPYKSIYDNPNSFGIASASICIASISLLFGHLEEKGLFVKKFLFSFISVITFYLSLFSGSRTSVVAILILILILILIYLYKNKFSFLKGVFFLCVFFVLIFYFKELVNENVFQKFENKYDSNDMFDGRGHIWETTLSNAGLFGKGSDYFSRTFSLGPHNSFISILGRLGYLFTLFFICIWFSIGYYSYRYTIVNKYKYSYVYFGSWLGFLILSITEVMLFRFLMMIFILSIGFVFAGKNRNIVG